MITSMLNLVCAAGHRHYAPNPNHWVGRECYVALTRDHKKTAPRCRAKLSLIR